ncbi:MAG: CRTAC1 family protein [Planctomycetes bacterium]|nr:CRTAC1 family protein [Planctomycetota bacterium]
MLDSTLLHSSLTRGALLALLSAASLPVAVARAAVPSPFVQEAPASAPASGAAAAAAPAENPFVLPDWPAIAFSEVAAASGIDCVNLSGAIEKPRLIDTLGSGMCWFDYDGDGWLDLFIPNGSTLEAVLGKAKNEVSDKLYRNKGDGTFEDVTAKAGLGDDRWSISAAAGDYDNDGDSDLYVTCFGPCFLYRNNGDGTFTDVAEAMGVTFGNVTPGAAWGDIDNDGDLDLYVSAYLEFNKKAPWPAFAKTMRNMKVMMGPQGLKGAPDKLFRNDGATFTEVTKEAGLRTKEEEYGFTIQMVDLNGDDQLDLFVANDMTPNHHYRQTRPGMFTPSGGESGLAVDHDGVNKACMGIALGDLNDDLIPDLFITNFAAQTNDLFLSQGDNLWDENPNPTEKVRSAMTFVGWGTGFFDFDLDGDEDLVAFNGHVFPQVDSERPRVQDYEQWPLLYRRDGPVKFSDAAKTAGIGFWIQRNCRGAGFADYDEDGDPDIALFQMDKPALLLRNDTAQKGHFLRVELLGTTVNRDAYGARIVVEAGGRRHCRWKLGQGSFISQNDPRALIGLGTTAVVDRITVRWPGGKEEVVEGPIAADHTVVIKEGRGQVGLLKRGEVWSRAQTAALDAK